MARHLSKVAKPTIFDVGANIGQSVDRFQDVFPGALIHSFEPSPSTFAELQRNCKDKEGVKLWNLGVGSKAGTLPLLENTHSDMTSFLAPGPGAWGEVARRTEVPVVSLDSFTEQEKIDRVHILKSDTQGYDFEVFKGAERLFAESRVNFIYCEVNICEMYQSQPPFYEVI
ncbi:MAG TPA: FkbM family methyltransferase, partial [Gemmatales bacterium]|nr:FkbM family methyltransferase [Gemmatales bacterium]